MLRALHAHNTKLSTPPERRVPIPEPIVLCEDKEVIGTPFYIMEFLEGRIFTDVRMPEVSPETRREWCVSLTATICIAILIAVPQLALCYPRPCCTVVSPTGGRRPIFLRPLHCIFPASDQVYQPRILCASSCNRYRNS